MTLEVHRVDLHRDREEVLAVLSRNLPAASDPARFRWLYLENPSGPAWSWFVRERSGRAVGMATVFPRAAHLDGKNVRCGVVGDFGIDASHRTLGPAVQLQRATFEPVDRGELSLCYDCVPHQTGMATFRRLGMDATKETHRYRKLLRVDGQVRRRLGDNLLATAAVRLGNAVLRMGRRGRSAGLPSGLEIRVHDGDFDEGFTALDGELRADQGLQACRTADILNWRYRRGPTGRYRVMVAERSGELDGFLVLEIRSPRAAIMEFFARSAQVEAALLRGAEDALPVATELLQVDLPGGHPAFQSAGYVRREAGPGIVAYVGQGELPVKWHVLTGDLGF